MLVIKLSGREVSGREVSVHRNVFRDYIRHSPYVFHHFVGFRKLLMDILHTIKSTSWVYIYIIRQEIWLTLIKSPTNAVNVH